MRCFRIAEGLTQLCKLSFRPTRVFTYQRFAKYCITSQQIVGLDRRGLVDNFVHQPVLELVQKTHWISRSALAGGTTDRPVEGLRPRCACRPGASARRPPGPHAAARRRLIEWGGDLR